MDLMAEAGPCVYQVYVQMFEDACAARHRGDVLPIESPLYDWTCNADVITATRIAIDDVAHHRPMRPPRPR
jgi:hypothetical protein